ncbi:MAG TPA: hypothetical protein VGZ90_03115 [Puia sp.]|nr:hypothetical protein [Puia sp.]
MDLEKELLKRQSLVQCNRIIKYIGRDETRFADLMKLFFKGQYRLTQHAAWPMSYCVRQYPFLVKPYYKKFIDQLSDSKAHPAARRNIVRLLQFVEIPKKFHGKLMDICFQFISNPEEAIAVKAFSLTILSNLSVIYPEILPEIKTVIEARWEFETPAFRSRASKILIKHKA